ncbi:MAG: SBBP repeat-containing protein [Candidatus Cloacimonetes bacterium]|nr:SBBP repeat-containing protein [Candidatus Cloacimonadota bacterium]
MVKKNRVRIIAGLFFFILLILSINAYAQAPGWQWAYQAGGSDSDQANRIYVDGDNNCYVTGKFRGTTHFGSYTLTSNGWDDVFIAKLDSDGNWAWAKSAGSGPGTSADIGNGITGDASGNIYVTGQFKGNVDFGSFPLFSNGEYDVFVAKLDPDGNWLWARSAGGPMGDAGRGIAVDDDSNVYVTGEFWDTVTFGTHSITSSGLNDVFVAKLNQNGHWQWAEGAGGSTSETGGRGVAVDAAGNCYVTGMFSNTATFGTHSISSNGWRSDIFTAKLNADRIWQWASGAGSTETDYVENITLDGSGNPYVVGSFKSTALFGYSYLTSLGDYDIFVAKLDQTGNWQWASQAGGVQKDYGYDISTDIAGNSYITGYFKDTAYFGAGSITSSGSYDVCVAKLGDDGTWLWAADAGGTGWCEGHGIGLDNDENCCVTGFFQGTAYFGTNSVVSSGSNDIFVAKIGDNVSSDPEIGYDIYAISHYPNPVRTITTIQYSMKEAALVKLEVYNLKGQLVETLFDENIQAGDHTVEWDCQDMPSGMYFLKMKAGDEESVRKMVLMR